MTRRGRPRGTGFDDGTAIARVRRLMVVRGLTRRAAIIAVCGIDQLRRIERKMALTRAWSDIMDIGNTDAPAACGEDPAEASRIRTILDAIVEHGLHHVFGENIQDGAAKMGFVVLEFSHWLRPNDSPDLYRSNTLNPFGPIEDVVAPGLA